MIFNYIKLAFRHLRKRTSYSFINLFGLAMGVCAALLILNYNRVRNKLRQLSC